MGLTGLGKVFAQVIRQISVDLRFIAQKIYQYIRLGVHYLYIYARKYAHFLQNQIRKFQEDPLKYIQFAGNIAIATYYGVF
jgi:hypothetical protein